MSALARFSDLSGTFAEVRDVPILLKKSKVARLRVFVKNPKQEAIADTCNFNRVTEVA
jgi:hypothetical protein